MSMRRVQVDAQRADRPDTGTDNVDSPVAEPGTVRGRHAGRVLEHSTFTALIGQRRRPTELLKALRGGQDDGAASAED
jgi:hypothetical protein